MVNKQDIFNKAVEMLEEDNNIKLAPVLTINESEKESTNSNIKRVRNLIKELASMLDKVEDLEEDDEYNEDDDIRETSKEAFNSAMIKIIDRVKEILGGTNKEEDVEKAPDTDEEEDKEEEEREELKLFQMESIESPAGIKYKVLNIIEEGKSLVQNVESGENFKIETSMLKKWKYKKGE